MKLRLGLHSLRSKVARRLVAMVTVLVLAPAIATGVISYFSVDDQVRLNTEVRLHEAARTYLQEIIGRLRIAASLLGDSVRDPARQSLTTAGQVLEKVSRGTVQADAAGLAPDLAAAVRRLAASQGAGTTTAVFRKTRQGTTEVWLATVGPAGDGQEYVTARVRPGFLWESAAIMPFQYAYCVTQAQGAPVFCPAEGPFRIERGVVPLAAATLSSLRATTHARADGDEYTLRAWRAPLIAGFEPLDLAVSVAAPNAIAYATQATFRASVGPAIGIAALSAILLAIVVIRRRLQPLDQLSAAAARLADGDFSGTVEVDADDEFLGLATMFDDMRRRLGRQFAEMGLLARLDRGIARLEPLPRLVESLLADLGQTFPGQKLAVLLPDTLAGGRVSSFVLRGGRIDIGRCGIGLGALGDGWRNEPVIRQLLGWPDHATAEQALAAWSRDADAVVALIIADAPTEPSLAAELGGLLQQVADRISIAAAEVRHRDRLYALGHYDDLTGLANRHLLRDRLRQWLVSARADDGRGHVLFVDLDGFKRVNDAEGHAVGDELLRQAARRLMDCAQEQDTVARVGGDEFVLLITSCRSLQDALLLANRIGGELRHPFRIGGAEHFLTASVGIVALANEERGDVDAVIGHADMAMYVAKLAGGDRAVIYQPDMQARATRRAVDEAALRDALARREFRLHYQPRVDLATGQLAGAEALLRWERPGEGLVAPGAFIQLAEETGLIREMGAWAIEEACCAYRRWLARGLVLREVSVNVSLRQVRDDDFVDRLVQILAATGMTPRVLTLEITESIMAEDLVRASKRLEAIRSTGVRISIDDFGTGFSSLSYLREFPIDEIKVDRAFLNGVPGTAAAERIVESIIQLGGALHKNVVVEGVERQDQYEFLRRAGCPQVQGYYVSRPMPETAFIEFGLRDTGLRSVA
ncbi:MAG: EAL domain-containing protein [Gammaproteobacteria bacterium]|nr:EAL domain-containing protein [Gammaproteobacteria bacterium]